MIAPKTIVQFLFGKREAIEKIASTNASLILGFLFIVSAGLARNYDHHILTEEPLWIGGPVGMTLFSSLFIYGFVKIIGGLNRKKITSHNYLAFLRCFAMTAPLAWLYGIPVEQFTDALPATQFNFTILLIVSIWRLALTVRIATILFHFNNRRAFALIAIPASLEMFIATFLKSINIVGIMGGIRLSSADRFLLNATQTVTVGSIILLAIALGSLIGPKGDVKNWNTPPIKPRISKPLWILAISVIAAWLVMAYRPQIQLANRAELRTLIQNDDYELAAYFLNNKTRSDFPTHQFIFRHATFAGSPPRALRVLANHNRWPKWMKDELMEDISNWIEESSDPESQKEDLYRDLYRSSREAPFIQDISDELTPGIQAADYFYPPTSSTKP